MSTLYRTDTVRDILMSRGFKVYSTEMLKAEDAFSPLTFDAKQLHVVTSDMTMLGKSLIVNIAYGDIISIYVESEAGPKYIETLHKGFKFTGADSLMDAVIKAEKFITSADKLTVKFAMILPHDNVTVRFGKPGEGPSYIASKDAEYLGNDGALAVPNTKSLVKIKGKQQLCLVVFNTDKRGEETDFDCVAAVYYGLGSRHLTFLDAVKALNFVGNFVTPNEEEANGRHVSNAEHNQ